MKNYRNNAETVGNKRFWKDRRHAYGWEVGFTQKVKVADGRVIKTYFMDIGVNKTCAIANSYRHLDICDNKWADYKQNK